MEQSVEQRVVGEQTRLLFAGSLTSNLTVAIVSLMGTAFLWQDLPAEQLLFWLGCMLVSVIVRLLLVHTYYRTRIRRRDYGSRNSPPDHYCLYQPHAACLVMAFCRHPGDGISGNGGHRVGLYRNDEWCNSSPQ